MYSHTMKYLVLCEVTLEGEGVSRPCNGLLGNLLPRVLP